MSSVSWDRAPTRRASAETAACSARAAFSLGPVGLDRGDATGREGEDEEHDGAAEHDPQTADQPGLRRACSAALRSSASDDRAGGSRNSRSVSVRVGSVRACQSSARVSRTPR